MFVIIIYNTCYESYVVQHIIQYMNIHPFSKLTGVTNPMQ